MSHTADSMEVHRCATVVDGHSDLFTDVATRRHLGEHQVFARRHLPLLQAGGVDVVFASLWIEPGYKPERAQKRALQLLGAALADLDESPESAVIVRQSADLKSAAEQQRVALVFGFEGGEPVEDHIESLRAFYEAGVRFLELTWNERNRLGDGQYEEARGGGLTRAGVEVVHEAERLGVLLDLSHMAPSSFWHTLEVATRPVMISHTCSRAIHEHGRNVTDEQVKAVAHQGGVVGLSTAAGHLGPGADLNKFIDHLSRWTQLVGAEHVGIGYDFIKSMFEGGSWPFSAEAYHANLLPGLEDHNGIPQVTQRLLQRGFSEDEVQLIMGGSWVRLLERVLR
jgi:membrane dipeptidase